MKLDSEPVFFHSALGHEPDSKAFEHNDITLNTAKKSPKLIVNENQKKLLCELEGTETNAVQLPDVINDGDSWAAIKFDCSMSTDDFKAEDKDEFRDFVASPTHSCRKPGSFDKDSDYVMEKGVTESEPPDLTVCYKENTYHIIKDICIDEGVPSPKKILFESSKDEKTVCIDQSPEKDQNKEVVKEKDVKMFNEDRLKCSLEIDSNRDSPNECDAKDLMQTGEGATNSIPNDASEEICLPGNKLPILEQGIDNDINKVEQQHFQVSGEKAILASAALISAAEESNHGQGNTILARTTGVHAVEESSNSSVDPKLATPVLVSSAEESNKGSLDEVVARPTMLHVAEESNKDNEVNNILYNSKVESGSITFDFDSLKPTAGSGEECLQNGVVEWYGIGKISKLESGVSYGPPVSKQHQHGQGEKSFSAVGQREESFSMVDTLSSLINYSGPIAYSGSLSLRSDSSTTSTRSFAFPVLQSEWNSSPVRMAKAERRQSRKHRNWTQNLLCCRF